MSAVTKLVIVLFVLVAGIVGSAEQGLAQVYSTRTYAYRVPYRNDYHGYWRDQGYGFAPRSVYYRESFVYPSYGYGFNIAVPYAGHIDYRASGRPPVRARYHRRRSRF